MSLMRKRRRDGRADSSTPNPACTIEARVARLRSLCEQVERLANLTYELQERAEDHIGCPGTASATAFHRSYRDAVAGAESIGDEELRGKVLYAIYQTGRVLNPLEAAMSLGGPNALIDEIGTALSSARMAMAEHVREVDEGIWR